MTTWQYIRFLYRWNRRDGLSIYRAAINAIMRGTERAPF